MQNLSRGKESPRLSFEYKCPFKLVITLESYLKMDSRWTKLLLLSFVSILWIHLPSLTLAGPSTTPTTPKRVLPRPTSNATDSTSTSSIPSKRIAKRPFYNIAHMINSLKEIDQYLAKGANGLETDVYFAPNATPVFMFHGYPCDCFRHCGERERVEVFLERIRELTTPNSKVYNPKLVILFFDLKLLRIEHSAKALAGQNLATYMVKHLYNGTSANDSPDGATVRTVISIGHVFDYDFILGFQNELESQGKSWLFREYIGWDVGLNDPLFVIESMWKRFDTVHNIWQGDGRSNCVSPFYNLARLSSIVKRRDQNAVGFGARNLIRKAYQWTVDLTVNIRTALRTNVDAIITNHPERLLHVMREREFVNRFRLATEKDSPWERVLVRTPKPTGTAAAAAILTHPTLGLKLVNGAGDMLDSFTKYVGDLLRYRTPVRYFFLSTYNKQQLFLKKRFMTNREGSMSTAIDNSISNDPITSDELVDFTQTNTTKSTNQTLNSNLPSQQPQQSLLIQVLQTVLKHLL